MKNVRIRPKSVLTPQVRKNIEVRLGLASLLNEVRVLLLADARRLSMLGLGKPFSGSVRCMSLGLTLEASFSAVSNLVFAGKYELLQLFSSTFAALQKERLQIVLILRRPGLGEVILRRRAVLLVADKRLVELGLLGLLGLELRLRSV